MAIALDVLGLERIDHGIAIAEDVALERRLASSRVPITVCPKSNVLIANRYRRLEAMLKELGSFGTSADGSGWRDKRIGRRRGDATVTPHHGRL